VSRGERIGLSVAAFGVGITVVSTALGLANVDMSAVILWLIGGFGGVLMFGGVVGAVVSWRQRDKTPDHQVSDSAPPTPVYGPPSSFPPGYIQMPPEPQRVIHSWDALSAQPVQKHQEEKRKVHDPRIVAGEVYSKYLTVGGRKIVDGEEGEWPTIRLYAIPFRNVAETGDSASTASDVVATVETFAKDGAFLDRAHGRWRELSHVAMEVNPSSASLPMPGVERAGKVTLAPDGQEHLLDVLAQDNTYLPRTRPSEGCWLVREPIAHSWFLASKSRLGAGSYQLKITLRGRNIPGGISFDYAVVIAPDPADNHEAEIRVTFKLIESP